MSLGRLTGILHLDRNVTEHTSDSTKERWRTGSTEVDILVRNGLNLKLLYEYMDSDQETAADTVDRFSVNFMPFLRPYFQFRAGHRDYTGPEGDETSNSNPYFLETHFLFWEFPNRKRGVLERAIPHVSGASPVLFRRRQDAGKKERSDPFKSFLMLADADSKRAFASAKQRCGRG